MATILSMVSPAPGFRAPHSISGRAPPGRAACVSGGLDMGPWATAGAARNPARPQPGLQLAARRRQHPSSLPHPAAPILLCDGVFVVSRAPRPGAGAREGFRRRVKTRALDSSRLLRLAALSAFVSCTSLLTRNSPLNTPLLGGEEESALEQR